MEEDPAERWKVAKEDWRRNRRYDRWLEAAEDMLALTDTPAAPWTVVEATDARLGRGSRYFRTLVERMQAALDRRQQAPASVSRTQMAEAGHARRAASARGGGPRARAHRRQGRGDAPRGSGLLRLLGRRQMTALGVDLTCALAPKEYEKRIAAEQLRLRALHFKMYEEQVPVLAVFEGWDAAGKGGAIKRVTETLEPRGYTVSSFSAPRGGGEDAITTSGGSGRRFPAPDTSASSTAPITGACSSSAWKGSATEEEWRRAYREINEFEAHQASFGMVVRSSGCTFPRRSSSAGSRRASAIPSARTS